LTPEANRTIEEIKKLGVTVFCGIDATKLHKHFKKIVPRSKDTGYKVYQKFHEIRWNFPYVDKYSTDKALASFLESCNRIQRPGGRVLITLIQEPGREVARQIGLYGIANAVGSVSYVALGARNFSKHYVPYGYEHSKTVKRGESVEGAETYGRTFVFEKPRSDTDYYELETTKPFAWEDQYYLASPDEFYSSSKSDYYLHSSDSSFLTDSDDEKE
jgi:rRNA (uridine-N3-)-methyltransferase BTM5-like